MEQTCNFAARNSCHPNQIKGAIMTPSKINIEKFRLRTYRNVVLLAVFIASCAQGPSAPFELTDNSKEGSVNTQTDTTQSQIHSKNSGSKESVLGMSLFVINNESSQSLGNLTISSLLGNQSLLVGPNQADSIEISFVPGLVILNLQVCLFPDTSIVILPTGAKVSVGWKNPNLISVIDYGTQN